MLRVMIVDDEQLAVKRLQRLLSGYGEIGAIETFLNPLEAHAYAQEHPVDIAFLDISMPDIGGMRLSGLLQQACPTIDIVFVTGSDEHAVKAFDMSALDYIMKPVTAERLASTMDKIRRLRRIENAAPSLEVRLFDGMKINLLAADGTRTSVKLRSPKTEELFAFLACKRTVSREEIVDTMWSDLPPEKAWKNLNSTLYYIRRAIDFDRYGSSITTTGHEIRLEAGRRMICDLYAFEQLLKEVRRSPDRIAELLGKAETLYAGSLLKGKSYDWATEYSLRLEHHYIGLLELAARHYRSREQLQQALHCYGEILKLDAIREDIHQQVIRLYVELGRNNDAARQYRMLEDMLKRELGTKPDPSLLDGLP